MYAVSVQITAYVDDSFPGWVSCALRDAHGRTWEFVEKAPVVSLAHLTPESVYPQVGRIACQVISRSGDTQGRPVALVDTSTPWSVESTEGNSQFEVFAEHLVEVADAT
jgi:hypothetical protein